jgi:hypothetical protein
VPRNCDVLNGPPDVSGRMPGVIAAGSADVADAAGEGVPDAGESDAASGSSSSGPGVCGATRGRPAAAWRNWSSDSMRDALTAGQPAASPARQVTTTAATIVIRLLATERT